MHSSKISKQLMHMLLFMEEHDDFARNRITALGLLGNDNKSRLWKKLTTELNAYGVIKTVKQWQAMWLKLKAIAKKNQANYFLLSGQTGNKECFAELDEISERVCAIFGFFGSGLSITGEVGIKNNARGQVALLEYETNGFLPNIPNRTVNRKPSVVPTLSCRDKKLILEYVKKNTEKFFGSLEDGESIELWKTLIINLNFGKKAGGREVEYSVFSWITAYINWRKDVIDSFLEEVRNGTKSLMSFEDTQLKNCYVDFQSDLMSLIEENTQTCIDPFEHHRYGNKSNRMIAEKKDNLHSMTKPKEPRSSYNRLENQLDKPGYHNFASTSRGYDKQTFHNSGYTNEDYSMTKSDKVAIQSQSSYLNKNKFKHKQFVPSYTTSREEEAELSGSRNVLQNLNVNKRSQNKLNHYENSRGSTITSEEKEEFLKIGELKSQLYSSSEKATKTKKEKENIEFLSPAIIDAIVEECTHRATEFLKTEITKQLSSISKADSSPIEINSSDDDNSKNFNKRAMMESYIKSNKRKVAERKNEDFLITSEPQDEVNYQKICKKKKKEIVKTYTDLDLNDSDVPVLIDEDELRYEEANEIEEDSVEVADQDTENYEIQTVGDILSKSPIMEEEDDIFNTSPFVGEERYDNDIFDEN